MRYLRVISLALCVALPGVGAPTEAEAEKLLHEYLACRTKSDDTSPCNMFVGRALHRLYGLTDFKTGPDAYVDANTIAAIVATSKSWVALGDATSQDALKQAQGYANVGKAVIAVRSGAPNGHVAIILPGTAVRSGAWNLDVPNSASFFLGEPDKSYVGKGLSYAFGKPEGVKLYGSEPAL